MTAKLIILLSALSITSSLALVGCKDDIVMQISIDELRSINKNNPGWIEGRPVVIEGELKVEENNIVISSKSQPVDYIDINVGDRATSCANQIDGETVYVFGVLQSANQLFPMGFIESASTGSRYCVDSTIIDEISSRSRF